MKANVAVLWAACDVQSSADAFSVIVDGCIESVFSFFQIGELNS